MLQTESTPIENYVQMRFAVNPVVSLIANWRIDPEHLQQIVIEHFRELGIYFVHPKQEPIIRRAVTNVLLFSPEVIGALKKKDLGDLVKQRGRAV